MIHGRVIAIHRNGYEVQTTANTMICTLSGRYQYNIVDEEDYPIVGDYVQIVETSDKEGIIERIFERKNKISRFASGSITKAQYIASNIDLMLICMSVNEDFNLTKLQNFINISYSDDVETKILLTKSDLSKDHATFLQEIHKISDLDIVFFSIYIEESIDALKVLLHEKTTVLIGSSGIGKSSIINALMQDKVFATKGIRQSDAQGRHTTTFRKMVALNDSTFVIDTPGIRIVNTYQTENIDQKFDDITSLAEGCQFRDCKHKQEPGCNVINAINNGTLNETRLISYNKIKKLDRIARAKQIAKFRKHNKNLKKRTNY